MAASDERCFKQVSGDFHSLRRFFGLFDQILGVGDHTDLIHTGGFDAGHRTHDEPVRYLGIGQEIELAFFLELWIVAEFESELVKTELPGWIEG